VFRYERKYYLADTDYDFVRSLILCHPASFRNVFHPRTVNNIYFDTPGFDFFYDNVNGLQIRKKIRIRWYDETFAFQKKLALEYKLKNGLLGDKKNYPLSNIFTGDGFEISNMKNELKFCNLPVQIENELLTHYPVLLNRYVREYFISDDGKCRITLDRDLSFYRINAGSNSFQIAHNVSDDVIMEMKYEPSDEKRSVEIGQHFPFRVTKSSKYVIGIQHLYAIN